MHKKFSPSKSKRWMNCHGSVAMANRAGPQETSAFAQEGTAAHKLLELCLINDKDPGDYTGFILEKVIVDTEMVEAIELTLEFIDEVMEEGDYELIAEQFVDAAHLHPDVGGTADVTLIPQGKDNTGKKKLHIFDLKYGVGVIVDPRDNPQGLNYGLFTIEDLDAWEEFDEYHFHIIQPRLPNEDERWKTAVFTLEQVDQFCEDMLDHIEQIEEGDITLAAGEWCRFCPGAGICPELAQKSFEVIKADFDDQGALKTVDIESLSDVELTYILDNKSVITGFLKAVEKYALGRKLKGQGGKLKWKLVASKKNRAWKTTVNISKVLEDVFGLTEEEIYVDAIKSPAQIDKLLDKEGRAELETYWEKPEGAPTIAPDSDPRPEIPAQCTEEDFVDYDD